MTTAIKDAPNAPESTNGSEATRKPPKAKKPPQRKAYKELFEDEQKDHADLQARVAMALRVLRKAIPEGAVNGSSWDLVTVAVETLAGE